MADSIGEYVGHRFVVIETYTALKHMTIACIKSIVSNTLSLARLNNILQHYNLDLPNIEFEVLKSCMPTDLTIYILQEIIDKIYTKLERFIEFNKLDGKIYYKNLFDGYLYMDFRTTIITSDILSDQL